MAPPSAPFPPSPRVRGATLDDVDELVRLRALMFTEMGEPADVTGEPRWRSSAAAFTRAGLAGGTLAAVVVDDPAAPGRLVASGVGVVVHHVPGPHNPSGTLGYVQSIVTERAWRRRGLAGAIVDRLLAWFVARGIGHVDLHATAAGDGVYRARGFTEAENRELRWRASAPAGGPAT